MEILNECLQQEKMRDGKCFGQRLDLTCYIVSPINKKCIIQLNNNFCYVSTNHVSIDQYVQKNVNRMQHNNIQNLAESESATLYLILRS